MTTPSVIEELPVDVEDKVFVGDLGGSNNSKDTFELECKSKCSVKRDIDSKKIEKKFLMLLEVKKKKKKMKKEREKKAFLFLKKIKHPK